jgi:hypothetical protein
MGIDKVVLVNSYNESAHTNAFMASGEAHIGLKLIRDLLAKEGFDNTILFPEKPYLRTEFVDEAWVSRYEKELDELIEDEENTVLGFSTATESYDFALELAKIARQKFPKLKIIAGGPHIRKQEIVIDEKHYFDSIFMAFLERTEDDVLIFDVVVDGFADSFVKYVLSEGKTDFPGIYVKNTETGIGYTGKGRSKMPDVSSFPIRFRKVNDTWGEIYLILEETCQNMCGYCSIMKHERDVDINAYANAVEEATKEVKNVLIRVADSCALKKDDLEPYESFFAELKKRKIRSLKGLYVDPQDFVGEEAYNKRFDFLNRYKVHNLFFGRDCVDHEVAKKIGRRYAFHDGEKWRRRVRTQKDLDNEKEALVQLIQDMKSDKFEFEFTNIMIPYIITPFETYESQRKIIDEAEGFHNMADGQYQVHVDFSMLAPFPGTWVRKKHVQLLNNPLTFSMHTSSSNDWSYDLGPQVYFMDAVFDVKRQFISENGKHPKFFDAMRRALDTAYAGRLQQKVWHERRL